MCQISFDMQYIENDTLLPFSVPFFPFYVLL